MWNAPKTESISGQSGTSHSFQSLSTIKVVNSESAFIWTAYKMHMIQVNRYNFFQRHRPRVWHLHLYKKISGGYTDHVTHPSLFLQEQLILAIIIIKTLKHTKHRCDILYHSSSKTLYLKCTCYIFAAF